MPQTVLLVAGHPGVRRALAERLAAGTPWVMETTDTVEAAAQALQERAPMVLPYVPTTPIRAAPAAVRQLSQRGVPVVVLTPTLGAGEEDALRQAGAHAVLLQETPLPAVRAALVRAASPEVADGDPAADQEEAG